MNTRNNQKNKDDEDNINILSKKTTRKGKIIKDDQKEDKKEEDKKEEDKKEEDKKMSKKMKKTKKMKIIKKKKIVMGQIMINMIITKGKTQRKKRLNNQVIVVAQKNAV